MLESLVYPQETIALLLEAAETLGRDEGARRSFLDFRDAWLSEQQEQLEDPGKSLWHALAVVSAYPALFEAHRRRGVPWEVTVNTLEDLPLRMNEFYRIYGFRGFDAQRWMRNHVTERLYQLGRLQFVHGKFGFSSNVYQVGSEPVPLLRSGFTCSPEGWLMPEDNTPADGWQPELTLRDGFLYGHTTEPDGRISREETAIPAESPLLLGPESDVLYTHIPTGGPLDTDACRASIARAIPFFDQYYPEQRWAAVCCISWLLDRAMADFDSPPAKIVAFGALYRPLACFTRDPNHYLRWIFGPKTTLEEARAVPSPTRLQKGVLDYVARGGQPRPGGGYILRDETAR